METMPTYDEQITLARDVIGGLIVSLNVPSDSLRGAVVHALEVLKTAASALESSPTLEPSRDEFIRALTNVIDVYDRVVRPEMLGRDPLDMAHIAEARQLLNAVLPKGPR